jgi:hypothetical protein
MRAIVGALRVVLGMDSAAFEQGASNAARRTAALSRSMETMGKRLSGIGKSMSAAVTGPLAGFAAATVAASGSMAELARQAETAGISAERMKVLGIAAKQAGFDQAGLADVLKDVNDKLGDFAATGAGPLADFFENIAPKVGITAKAFEGLSSDQSLQLYVSSLEKANVSQAEMTFYMEALASEATALLPLFRDNGAAIKDVADRAAELGLSIDKDMIGKAKEIRRDFGIVAEVLGTQVQGALVGLLPAFAKLGTAMLPAVRAMVDGISTLANWFGDLSPRAQKFVGIGIGLTAMLGPLAIALGGIAVAVSLIASPITLTILAVAALVAGAALIYMKWDGVAAWFRQKFEAVRLAISEKVAEIRAAVRKDFSWTAIIGNWTGVKLWATERMKSVENGIVAGWDAIKLVMAGYYEDFKQIGVDIVEGLRLGIVEKFEAVKKTFADSWEALKASARDAFGIKSPSRVFKEYGGQIMAGLANGIEEGTPEARAAMDQMAGDMGGDGLLDQLAKMKGDLAGVGKVGAAAFESIGAQIGAGIKQGKGFRSILGGLAGTAASALSGMAQDGIKAAFSSSPNMGGFLSSLAGGLMGFKDGGSFMVGGAGGIDSQLVAFNASPNERVSITKPGQDIGAGGALQLVVRLSDDLDARVESVAGPLAARIAVRVQRDGMAAQERERARR